MGRNDAKEARRTRRVKGGRFRFISVLSVSPWLISGLVLAGCRQDMHDLPRYKPLARSAFFGDGRSARPMVEDTVARGQLRDDSLLYSGKLGKDFADAFPFPVERELLRRGQQRYTIYCSPCHDQLGRGDGIVVRRGFKNKPASFHSDRLRGKPAGYFFDVMTSGFGAMQDYSAQIAVKDRWAIVAYVRALQLSQNASIEDVPPAHRGELGPGGAR